MKLKPDIENFYGIGTFGENPLPLTLKSNLSKFLYLNPEVSAENAKIISHTYIKDSYAEKLLERMKSEVSAYPKKMVFKKLLQKTETWIITNGFLNMFEVYEICEYCNSNTEIYFKKLDNLIKIIKVDHKRFYKKYLEAYSNNLNETQINLALDRIIELRKISIPTK